MLHLLRNFIFNRSGRLKKREGFKWFTNLPHGYDERTRLIALWDGRLVAIHPDHPALISTSEGFVPIILI